MKAFLMYQDHDFDLQQKLLEHERELSQDLELMTLFKSMADGDKFLFEVAKKALFSRLDDLDTIIYRQNILRDCLKNPAVIREIYNISVELIEKKRKTFFGIFNRYPSSILYSANDVMRISVDMLKKLKKIANEHAGKFVSDGFKAFFAMLDKELGDEYFASVENHLEQLQFRNGVLISAELGEGNKGANYMLRKPLDSNTHNNKLGWVRRIFAQKPPAYTVCIGDRDESGARALSELKDRGINLVANALAQSADHIISFFNMLRTELAFYIGCLNLHEQLAQKGQPVSFPRPVAAGERRHSFKGLYDACLALSMEQRVVGNDVDADSKDLVMITGANQGGKSTFLRSIGLAQMMMQCGMFVPAESFSSNICKGLFTHYKREEDATMSSGKLDEELSRMSDIVDMVKPNSMLLFNESFAATNEREGSEIARQIVSALLEKHVKVFFVTHLYDLASGFYNKRMANAAFLRAERQSDGSRTFKLIEGKPLQTSFGEDLYNGIFGKDC